MPYYVLREECGPAFHIESPIAGNYRSCFLEPADMAELCRIDSRPQSPEELIERLEAGRLCLALKEGDRIAAFTWVNLTECDAEPEKFALLPNEAYLFDSHTVSSFRGRGLAVHLRCFLYEALGRENRIVFYSISERFNRSSLRFKEKLGARIVRSGIYISLFDRLKLRWVLKDYARTGYERNDANWDPA